MRTVSPDATRAFEQATALIARAAMSRAGLAPFECPLEMVVDFRVEGDPGEWPTGQSDGDLDNMEKAIKDALNGVAYLDDRLIVRKTGLKQCAARAGITLMVRPATP
jgi:Holliday junction resolvase RusA-like endonuclease